MNYEIKELIYANNTINIQVPKALHTQHSDANIAIVIHLYYHDLWEKEINAYLSQLKVSYDLYITLPKDVVTKRFFNSFMLNPMHISI